MCKNIDNSGLYCLDPVSINRYLLQINSHIIPVITKLRFPILLTATLCLFLFSCVSSMKTTIEEDGKQIPPGFGKKNEILLVIRKDKKSYDKYLEKNFSENYFGRYLIIDRAELESNKYKNTDTYRYVFDEDYHEEYKSANPAQIAANGGRRVNSNGTTVDYGQQMYAMFQVMDRKSGTVYKTKHGTGAFSKWMRAYIQALEKARLKN